MATPKQVQINLNLSEDFRKSSHGKWALKPQAFSQKVVKVHPQLAKHKSEVEDLASQFPEIPDPKCRTKEKVFAIQSSAKGGAKWCGGVVMSVLDDRASTSEGIKSAILDMKCEVCRIRI